MPWKRKARTALSVQTLGIKDLPFSKDIKCDACDEPAFKIFRYLTPARNSVMWNYLYCKQHTRLKRHRIREAKRYYADRAIMIKEMPFA